MLVVSDTSPVTALLQIGQAGLLTTLFGHVVIPPTVKHELLRFHASLPENFEIRPIRDRQAVEALRQDLDQGEAEAIVLAEECQADYLLIDEKRARSVAEARGLRVVGLLGVLLIAKDKRHISSVTAILAELESRAGFFVSDTVKQIVLRAAGEGP